MIKILLSDRLGEKRMTQSELARTTGIRPGTISEIYHELVDRVSLNHLDFICEALGCDISELLSTKKPCTCCFCIAKESQIRARGAKCH